MLSRLIANRVTRARRGVMGGALWAAILVAFLASAAPGIAQTQDVLKVAVKPAAPFAMKSRSGQWEGLTVDLWRRVAAETGLKFEFVETDLKSLLDGVATGRYAVGLGALTITPQREKRLDFSHSFYSTGLAIAARQTGAGFWTMIGNLVSGPFLYAVGLLIVVLLAVGLLFWLFERSRNSGEFGGSPRKGIGSGLWLAAVTMTTVGYGDKAPVTLAGRIVALVWMFAALIVISTFTGAIASSLTVNRLAGAIQGPDDLPKVSVGSIRDTSAAAWLTGRRINFRTFESVDAGLKAVADKRIDAFVYDAPLMKYLLKQRQGDDSVTVLPAVFDRQDYGIALEPGSPHREKINVALLNVVRSEAWRNLVFSKIGD